MTITPGRRVKLHYTLSVEGQKIQETKADKPFEYTQGTSDVFPAMQAQLEGLAAGDEKRIRLAPEESFGRPRPDLIMEADKGQFGPSQLEIGTAVSVNAAGGKVQRAQIKEVHQDKVVLDFNHPLAGKNIDLNVRIEAVV